MENFKSFNYRGVDLLVGDCGTIYRNGKPVVQRINPCGYLQIALPCGSVHAHRIIAMCWVPGQTDERNEVNHKDFNRTNNCATNLEWMSHAENVRYSAQAGRKGNITGEKNPNWGNRKLSKKYAEDPSLAKQCQSRPGTQNGRATPVTVYRPTEDGREFVASFPYLGAASTYMCEHYGFPSNAETFRLGVRRSISTGVPYKGFIFEKNVA